MEGARLLIADASLSTPESLMSEDFWPKFSIKCANFCSCVLSELNSNANLFSPPPANLIICVGGILGNLDTSRNFHACKMLSNSCQEIMSSIVKICNVKSTRDLLLSTPCHSSKPHSSSLAGQMLKLCVAAFSRSRGEIDYDEPFNKCPLHRDALVWMVGQLNYPDLSSDDQFIPILQPLTLRIVQDHRSNCQLTGLRMLREMAIKTKLGDLRHGNRNEAVLSQLTDFRISSSHDLSQQLFLTFWTTCFTLLDKLEEASASEWYDKFASKLLFDLLMESRVENHFVLLNQLSTFMNKMQAAFAVHAREFFTCLPIVLLGPRNCLNDTESMNSNPMDLAVYKACFDSIQIFVKYAWPLLSTSTFVDLFSPVIAFIELESNLPTGQSRLASLDGELRRLFVSINQVDPKLIDRVLNQLGSDVAPNLKPYLTSC